MSVNSPVPNRVLIQARQRMGWKSRGRAARELYRVGLANNLPVPDLQSLEKALYRHETGRSTVRDPLYIDLYSLAYESTAHELFGDAGLSPPEPRDHFRVVSHKFITAYVGPDLAAEISTSDQESGESDWLACSGHEVNNPHGECILYTWPFGSAVFHLSEVKEFEAIAELSIWRLSSYERDLEWGTSHLRQHLGREDISTNYVLSCYWLDQPIWTGAALETALRLLSMPRILVRRGESDDVERARLVETARMSEGFDHPDIVSFGVQGTALGFASWSGVANHPMAPSHSLAPDELVSCELATQALWTYCDHINRSVENGTDPQVGNDFSWRFLRGMKSRLTNPRPQETGQHKIMRQAIVQTSGVDEQLSQAIDLLRGGI